MKNKYTIIGIIITTLLLAGIAIFTALRLYQTRDVAVAPNVPSSKPKAQEIPNTCNLSFTLTQQGNVACEYKKVYLAANNTASITDKDFDFSLGSEIQNNGNVIPGQEIIYVIKINETNSGLSYTTSDTLDPKLDYIKYKSTDNCSVNSTTQTISCNGTDIGRSDVLIYIKAKVKTTTILESLANTANVSVGQTPISCNVSINVSKTPTAPPTVPPTVPPTGSPNSCGGTCGSNSNCQSNFMCYQGFCRNASCVTETDCTCAVATTSATVTPTQPTLPVVGTSWPTLLGTGFGILVVIGSLLLAL